jgi:DNA-binding HxlR family transcriptional regulator
MRKSTTDEIIGSYQDRFTGFTNGTQNSFKMKKQLEHKLKELEDSDVIEKVQGPTPWVSPLVVVPKANSDIRICVDMRCANKAVQRERFPMPNIEEIIQQING